MKFLATKNIRYLVIMTGVIGMILIVFNIIFTLQVHKKIVPIVSQPGRWPAGAYIYDKNIGFDFAPNISGPVGDGSFYVKSHRFGYRIGEHEDAGSFQPGGMLSLGCSYTYGDEVNADQTFTQVAADSLNIPAYNYGICSFSYTHALLKAEKLKREGILDQLRPRYVVLGCWSGLPDRSRTPFPPLASGNLPFPAAYLAKDGDEVHIKYPMKIRNVFNLVELYRQEGTDLTVKKFMIIFVSVPRYIYLYTRYNRLVESIRTRTFRNDVRDKEIYDFYFTGIESVFAEYQAQIIVLYMPHRKDEKPDRELREALAGHPGIILANGLEAINKYGVPTRDYQARHPQPSAHQAFAREIVEAIGSK